MFSLELFPLSLVYKFNICLILELEYIYLEVIYVFFNGNSFLRDMGR